MNTPHHISLLLVVVLSSWVACSDSGGEDASDASQDTDLVDVSQDAPITDSSASDGDTVNPSDLGLDTTSDTASLDTSVDAEPDTVTLDISEDTGDGVEPDTATLDTSVDVEPDADPASDCGQIETFETGLVPVRELHVALDGDDASGDGSAEAPWGTLAFAAERAQPGDAVRIHPGTWPGGTFLTDLRGQEGAPIWVGGLPGAERPVIDADGGSEGLHLVRPRYVVLHDLVVRGARNNGVNTDDGGEVGNPDAARFIVFRGLQIEDVGTGGNNDCLKLSGLDDYWVLDSRFERCGGGGSGVDHVGCHRGLLARNTFVDLGSSGIQNKGGSVDIEIRWNHFRNAGARPVNMGGSTGEDFFRPPLSANEPNVEAARIHVVANLFEGGETAAAFVGCVACVFAHNTVVLPERWVWRILQETVSNDTYTFQESQRGQVVNNLIVFDPDQLSRAVNVSSNTQPETFTFAHNLWFAQGAPERSAPQLPVEETGAVIGQDPGLGAGFAIEADSPAARAGSADGLRWVTGDMQGACYADPPSIGAFAAPEP
ncbi:MAG: hypothetical protein AAFX99_18220 [Myxococcota bacterium]